MCTAFMMHLHVYVWTSLRFFTPVCFYLVSVYICEGVFAFIFNLLLCL